MASYLAFSLILEKLRREGISKKLVISKKAKAVRSGLQWRERRGEVLHLSIGSGGASDNRIFHAGDQSGQ
jgi:hypothetical protein